MRKPFGARQPNDKSSHNNGIVNIHAIPANYTRCPDVTCGRHTCAIYSDLWPFTKCVYLLGSKFPPVKNDAKAQKEMVAHTFSHHDEPLIIWRIPIRKCSFILIGTAFRHLIWLLFFLFFRRMQTHESRLRLSTR